MIPPHAVPQNILDIEFKLFGSLTVKQFSYIAGSLGVGLIFYFTLSALPLLMWPLILASGGLGLMLALVKINERTFDIWLTNYIFAVFTSQRSIYQKSIKKVSILENLDDEVEKIENDTKAHIEDSKFQTPTTFATSDKSNLLDIDETAQLSDIDDLFDSLDFGLTPIPKVQTPPAIQQPFGATADFGKTPIINPVPKGFETFGLNDIKNTAPIPLQPNVPAVKSDVMAPENDTMDKAREYYIKSNANVKKVEKVDLKDVDKSMMRYFTGKLTTKRKH